MSEDLLKDYAGFVDSVTSQDSKELESLIERLRELEASNNINVARLMTGAIGLSGETGEFSDLVKKVFFHRKELDSDVEMKLKKELGDIAWYWVNACTALGVNPQEAIRKNIEKLESRYPGGFSAWRSENRSKDDV